MKIVSKWSLMCAGMTVLATACEKENNNVADPLQQTERNKQLFQMRYTINEESHFITLQSEAAYQSFICNLMDLVLQGNRISIQLENNTSTAVYAQRDVQYFETKNKEELDAWGKRMTKDGYHVTIEYNKETGIFTGTATKE